MRLDSSIYDSHNYTMITVDLCSILLSFSLIFFRIFPFYPFFVHLLPSCMCGSVSVRPKKVIETIFEKKK